MKECDISRMNKPTAELIDGYFALRVASDGLREVSSMFEAIPWKFEDGCPIRVTDAGWKLSVYRAEGDIEVCVLKPDGISVTFS